MSQNVTDVHLLPIEMDGGDQAVLVAADIEHDISPNFICTGECLTQFIQAMKPVCSEYSKPSVQRSFAIRMPPREFSQGLTRDNVHRVMLPQIIAFDKCFSLSPTRPQRSEPRNSRKDTETAKRAFVPFCFFVLFVVRDGGDGDGGRPRFRRQSHRAC